MWDASQRGRACMGHAPQVFIVQAMRRVRVPWRARKQKPPHPPGGVLPVTNQSTAFVGPAYRE